MEDLFKALESTIRNTENRIEKEQNKKKEQNILEIRSVYESLLAEFPLDATSWLNYAEHEVRVGSKDEVVAGVYKRALERLNYSVYIWSSYCDFATDVYQVDIVRSLFEQALKHVGTNYDSYELWRSYIDYEVLQKNWPGVASIYTRMLEAPIDRLDRHFTSFQILAKGHPLSELMTSEEAREFEVQKMDGETNHSDLEKYIAVRQEIYEKTEQFVSKITSFELAIKRPYFSVRPLNDAQLENWHNYLDFIEGVGDLSKVFNLYERCLIACANYPVFWTRFVLWMEAKESMDKAYEVLTRATDVFVKRLPEIHIFAARFKEHNKDFSGARAAYELVDLQSPGHLEAISRHANMEHRLGKPEDAISVYERAIAIEKGKKRSKVLHYLFSQYSRFLYLVCGDAEKARRVLDTAVESGQLPNPVLEAFINFESILPNPKRICFLDSLVGKSSNTLTSKVKFVVPTGKINAPSKNTDPPESSDEFAKSQSEKENLSCIYLEFLDLFGDEKSIEKAVLRHSKLFPPNSSKRNVEEPLTSENPKLAKSNSGIPVPVIANPQLPASAPQAATFNKDILEAQSPLHILEAISGIANRKRRLGKHEEACLEYDQAIATEKGKEQSQVLAYLISQYSQFLHLVCGNVKKAQELLDEAVEICQPSKPLLEAFIHLESIRPYPKQVEYLDLLVKKFIAPSDDSSCPPSISEREDLSCIYLEFLDRFVGAKSIKKAYDWHFKFFLHHNNTSDSRKCNDRDLFASVKRKLAKSYLDVPVAAPSVLSAYASKTSGGSSVQPKKPPGPDASGQPKKPTATGLFKFNIPKNPKYN